MFILQRRTHPLFVVQLPRNGRRARMRALLHRHVEPKPRGQGPHQGDHQRQPDEGRHGAVRDGRSEFHGDVALPSAVVLDGDVLDADDAELSEGQIRVFRIADGAQEAVDLAGVPQIAASPRGRPVPAVPRRGGRDRPPEGGTDGEGRCGASDAPAGIGCIGGGRRFDFFGSVRGDFERIDVGSEGREGAVSHLVVTVDHGVGIFEGAG
mmetsp:Transcript_42131/g.82639  ORF Transcript_42131/g.82639 Transcript_42131/m.82639 type:complete len:209 (-) Transcript_42131:139-765(-)